VTRTFSTSFSQTLAPTFLIPLTQVALTGSVYTIVAITVERYVSCCWPHVPSRQGGQVSALTIGGILAFCLVFNVTRFFEYRSHLHEFSDEELSPDLRGIPFDELPEDIRVELRRIQETLPRIVDPTDFRKNPRYIRYYLLAANCTLMVFLPVASLIFLNYKIHKAIEKREHFRATMTTKAPSLKSPADGPAKNGGGSNGHRGSVAVTTSADAAEAKRKKEREVTIGQVLVIIVVTFVVTQSFKVSRLSSGLTSFGLR